MRTVLIIIVVLAVLLGVLIWGTYNNLVTLDESFNKAWAQVETVLQRRYDLIPNLVNTVKGYAQHEAGVLEEVTRLRSQWAGAQTTEAKAQTATAMESALGRLMVVVEKYPDLKANQNFIALQDELAGTENRIAVKRQRYNDAVRQYNTAVRQFPAVFFARAFGFNPKDAYFQASEQAAQAPSVEF